MIGCLELKAKPYPLLHVRLGKGMRAGSIGEERSADYEVAPREICVETRGKSPIAITSSGGYTGRELRAAGA